MSSWSPGRPRLSVVTPTFNCLSLTKEMLASLKASMPPLLRYEVILVDDGSTDGTREWLSGLGPPFRVVFNERNIGFGASTNRGASLARGTVLALLNNDLVLRRGWLGPMYQALEALGPFAGLVGNIQVNAATGEVDHAGIGVNNKGKPEHIRQLPRLASRVLLPVRGAFAVTGACLLVHASVWRRMGGFDESYVNGCEDVDLCLRAREAGLINAVALRSRVLHHVSASPGRKLRDEENTWRLVRRWRDKLAAEGSREWTREHFRGMLPEPRDFPDTADALRTALYLLHLRRDPPQAALDVRNAAIDVEVQRWQRLFPN